MNTYYLNELKKRFKIRNRFWRKSFYRLKPEIDKLYLKSIIKNYFPFRIALSKTLTKLNQKKIDIDEIETIYLNHLVFYLNLYKHRGLILNPDQKARLVKIKNKVYINIINKDASEDPEKRKKIQEINHRILSFLKHREKYNNKDLDVIFMDLIEPKISNLFIKSDFNLIQDFVESPIGKMLNQLIPGLNLLLEIQRQKELIKKQDFIQIANHILFEQIKNLTKRLIYIITSNFKNVGKYIAPPLAYVTSIAFERYYTYKNCYEILNKNLNKLQLIKEKIENEKKEELTINNNEDIKKLLAIYKD